MPDIKWTVTLGVAVVLDGDSTENPWYRETCEVEAPDNVDPNILRDTAAEIIIPEMGSAYGDCINNIWLDEYYPSEEDDEWDEEIPGISIQ
jgi:hypothetical protein